MPDPPAEDPDDDGNNDGDHDEDNQTSAPPNSSNSLSTAPLITKSTATMTSAARESTASTKTASVVSTSSGGSKSLSTAPLTTISTATMTSAARESTASTKTASVVSTSSGGSRSQYIVFADRSADLNSLATVLSSKAPTPSKIFFEEATGIVAYWAIPSEATDAPTAGLTSQEADAILEQPGINDVVLNVPLTVDEVSTTTPPVTTATTPTFDTLTIQPLADPVLTLPSDTPPDLTDVPQPVGTHAILRRDLHRAKSNLRVSLDVDAPKARQSRSARSEERAARLEKRLPPAVIVGIQRRSIDRTTGDYFTNGQDVPYELRAVSQPNVVPAPDLSTLDYVYRTEGGRNTWVYVIDSGVYASHSVSFIIDLITTAMHLQVSETVVTRSFSPSFWVRFREVVLYSDKCCDIPQLGG